MAASILHVDMDAFYASVEQAHKPSLRGKPVVVGGVGLRGVVSTASYEARVFGIRSAMPTAQARRLCPNAAYLYPRFGAYHAVSSVVMELLRQLSPLVEPVSLDEAFVDLAASADGPPRTEAQAREVGRRLGAQIHAATGLTGSVGIGTSKLIAKVASEARKPAGVVVVPDGREQEWLDPLPVRALWGVGPATADRLRRVGVGTVADLRVLTRTDLVGLLGVSWGGSLYQLARGIDARKVEVERPTKSVSAEDTYPHDLIDQAETRTAVGHLVERVVARLRAADLTGRTVSVKARGHDFTTVTRAETFAAPTDDVRMIRAAALRLLGSAIEAATATSSGIRLLGVAVTGLADFSQGDLMAELEPDGFSPDDETVPDGGPAEPQAAEDTDEAAAATRSAAESEAERAETAEHAEHARSGPSTELPKTGDAEEAHVTHTEQELQEALARTRAERAQPGGGVPALTLFGPVPVDLAARRWPPGLDVRHAQYGPGWVQGAGVGRVTVRFEGPGSPVGKVRTFAVTDPELEEVDSAEIAVEALAGRAIPNSGA
jgi:DNA polymerase IV